MLTLFRKRGDAGLTQSILLDNRTFYPSLLSDIKACKRELIIESPFIAQARMDALYPSFRRLTKRGVQVVINTRDPDEHDDRMRPEAVNAISMLQELGVTVLFTERHHRKLAILDREILYEGSLNILSNGASCEVMRRIESRTLAAVMLHFLRLEHLLPRKTG